MKLTSFSQCYSFFFGNSLPWSVFWSSQVKRNRSSRHRHASLNTRCFDHKWKFFSTEKREKMGIFSLILSRKSFLFLAVAWIFNKTGWNWKMKWNAICVFASAKPLWDYEEKQFILFVLRETVLSRRRKKVKEVIEVDGEWRREKIKT